MGRSSGHRNKTNHEKVPAEVKKDTKYLCVKKDKENLWMIENSYSSQRISKAALLPLQIVHSLLKTNCEQISDSLIKVTSFTVELLKTNLYVKSSQSMFCFFGTTQKITSNK